MSFRVLLRPEAEADIGDAATWYEEQKAGLGREFVEAIFHAVAALSANPLLTSRRHRRRNIRWVFPDRFPYRIIYEVAKDTVLIISILHAARHDRHWRERLTREPL
jgi:plasmid stabilization system protein ParE